MVLSALARLAGARDAVLDFGVKRPRQLDSEPATTAVTQNPQPKAIRNLGNTCYMNCVLQALFSCSQLRSFFLSGPVPSQRDSGTANEKAAAAHTVLTAMDVLFQAQFSPQPKLMPQQMLAACTAFLPTLRIGTQEDAHEFLHLILDVLDRVILDADRRRCAFSECALAATHAAAGQVHRPRVRTRRSGPAAAPQSLAAYTFGGTLQSDITCECGNVSSRWEPFMDISVDVGVRAVPDSAVNTRAAQARREECGTRTLSRLASPAPRSAALSAEPLSRNTSLDAPLDEAASSVDGGDAPRKAPRTRMRTRSRSSTPEAAIITNDAPADPAPAVIEIGREHTVFLTPEASPAPGGPAASEGEGARDTAQDGSKGATPRSASVDGGGGVARGGSCGPAASCGTARSSEDGAAAAAAKAEADEAAHRGEALGSGTTLNEALARLVRAEPMTGYICEACGRVCNAHKQLSLRSLPPVLVIHAKRFRHGNKLRDPLRFPVDEPLDMTPYTTEAVGSTGSAAKNSSGHARTAGAGGSAAAGGKAAAAAAAACGAPPVGIKAEETSGHYRLQCVIEHIGNNINHGHYVAFVRNGSRWVKCNDLKVSESSAAKVQDRQAYLLIYNHDPA